MIRLLLVVLVSFTVACHRHPPPDLKANDEMEIIAQTDTSKPSAEELRLLERSLAPGREADARIEFALLQLRLNELVGSQTEPAQTERSAAIARMDVIRTSYPKLPAPRP